MGPFPEVLGFGFGPKGLFAFAYPRGGGSGGGARVLRLLGRRLRLACRFGLGLRRAWFGTRRLWRGFKDRWRRGLGNLKPKVFSCRKGKSFRLFDLVGVEESGGQRVATF